MIFLKLRSGQKLKRRDAYISMRLFLIFQACGKTKAYPQKCLVSHEETWKEHPPKNCIVC
jgi:hypothetical protein